MSQRHKRCVCGKLDCRDMDEARTVHARIWAERGGDAKIRIYQCPYQLSTQPEK